MMSAKYGSGRHAHTDGYSYTGFCKEDWLSDSDFQDDDDQCHVFVSPQGSKFPDNVGESDLRKFFCSKFGRRQVKYWNILRNKRSKKSKGLGRVKFSSHAIAKEAIATLNGSLFLGRYRLYIGFEREPEVKEVPFQCTPEHMLYLCYCFFDSPSKQASLKQALSAKVINKDSSIYLVGRNHEIESSCEMLDRFLSKLHHKKVSFKYNSNYEHLLKERFIPNIAQSEVTCILKTDRVVLLIQVYLFSHDSELLVLAWSKFQALQPQSVRYSLSQASSISKSDLDSYISDVSKKHDTITVKESGQIVVIHGLKIGDIEESCRSLRKRVDSTVLAKKVSVKLFQLKHMQHFNVKELQQHSPTACQVELPAIHKTSALETKYQITVTGMLSKVDPIVNKLESLKDVCVLEKCAVQCPKKYLPMWQRRWQAFSSIKKAECRIVIEHTVECAVHSDTTVKVRFDIYGAMSAVQSEKQKILNEENSDSSECLKVSRLLELTDQEIQTLKPNIVELRKQFEDSYLNVVGVRLAFAYLSYPANAIIDIPAAVVKLKALIASIPCAQTVKKITLSDKQLAKLMVHLLSNLDKQKAAGTEITMRKNSIEVEGTPEGTKKTCHIIQQYLKFARTKLTATRLPIPVKYISIISSEICSSLSELEKEAGVDLFIPVPRTDEAVLEQATINNCNDYQCTVQLCKGSILSEKVDAVIVPIDHELRTSVCAANNLILMSGSSLKDAYTEYVSTNKILPGDAFELACENLPFHTVIFVVTQLSSQMVLSRAMQKALNLACESRLGCLSLSIDIGLTADVVCQVVLDELKKNSVDLTVHTIRILTPGSLAPSQQALISNVFQQKSSKERLSQARGQSSSLAAGASLSSLSSQRDKQRWYWKDDFEVFVEYNQTLTDHLNSKWRMSPNGSTRVIINGQYYDIDFQDMTQTNCSTQTRRDIRRSPSSMIERSDSIRWLYQDDSGSFSLYEKEHSEALERMYQNQSSYPFSTGLRIGKWTYEFDLATMHQINVQTKRKRPIKREIESEPQETRDENEAAADFYIGLRGIKYSVEEAATLIMSKLESLLTTRSIDLPPGRNVAEHKIKNISQKHEQVEILRVERSLRISGSKASVNGALIDIQAEVIASQSQVGRSEPTEWCAQVKTCELFEVPKNSSEWEKISSHFLSTMSGYKITSIKRVQNQLLWKKYAIEKETVEKKNGGEANEKLLFHGSRKVRAEDIVDSDNGLDTRVSSKGMWGRANYFAEKSNYSDSYAYQCQVGSSIVKEMLLFKVVTGDSITLPPDSSLQMPPERETSGTGVTLKKVRYDTVNGVTNGCRVYMTYDNYKSYPAYVITYCKRALVYSPF